MYNFTEITSFEIACQRKRICSTLPDVSHLPVWMQKKTLAEYQLTVIRNAIVGDWVADFGNKNQEKWWCWFEWKDGGFRFLGSRYDFTYTRTYGGSRLCCETKEQSDFLGQQFIALWNDMLIVPAFSPAEIVAPADSVKPDSNYLLEAAKHKIQALQAENERMAVRLQMFDDFMLLFRTAPAYRGFGLGEDLAYEIEKHLEGAKMAKTV